MTFRIAENQPVTTQNSRTTLAFVDVDFEKNSLRILVGELVDEGSNTLARAAPENNTSCEGKAQSPKDDRLPSGEEVHYDRPGAGLIESRVEFLIRRQMLHNHFHFRFGLLGE